MLFKCCLLVDPECPAGATHFKAPLLLLLRGRELCHPGRALQVLAAK